MRGLEASVVIRILIADDHALIAQGIAALLATVSDFEVVCIVTDANHIAVQAALHRPDLALVDVCMIGLNGIKATGQIRRASPECRIVGVSAYDDPALVAQMIEAGATGYVVKSKAAEELVEAIRRVAAGGACFKGVEPPPPSREKRSLSKREEQFLTLLAAEEKIAGIAAKMGVSPKTVETYRRRVMAKLGVSSQIALIRCAIALEVRDIREPG